MQPGDWQEELEYSKAFNSWQKVKESDGRIGQLLDVREKHGGVEIACVLRCGIGKVIQLAM